MGKKTKKEVSVKIPHKEPTKALKRFNKNNKPKRLKSSGLLKHADGISRQRSGPPFSPRRKIKLSKLSRKLLNGTYISPYRQQLKKTNNLSELNEKEEEEEEEDDYREIELDVKIKVTQRDDNVNDPEFN